jgi:hypothetical protein
LSFIFLFLFFPDLPGIGQTIELLTVTTPSEGSATTSSSFTVQTSSQASQSQSSAESLLQELTSLIQQPHSDIVTLGIEQKALQQSIDTKSSIHMATQGSRQARTANTYGGTPVVGGSRPGTAVKSTVASSGGATIRKPFQQQTINDDRMFFGRPTSSLPSTIGQGQYHNRTGLMSTNKQQQQQSIVPLSSIGQQQRRITTSSGIEHQQSSQRRPLSWFQ